MPFFPSTRSQKSLNIAIVSLSRELHLVLSTTMSASMLLEDNFDSQFQNMWTRLLSTWIGVFILLPCTSQDM